MDVGQHASPGDGNVVEELVELLVIADCETDVARNDALLLVVLAGIPRQLQDLSGEIFDRSSHVHRWAISAKRGRRSDLT